MSSTNVILETGAESGPKRNVGTLHFDNLPEAAPGLVNPVNVISDDPGAPAETLPFRFDWKDAPDESSDRLDELASRIGNAISLGAAAGREDEYEWRVD